MGKVLVPEDPAHFSHLGHPIDIGYHLFTRHNPNPTINSTALKHVLQKVDITFVL